MYLWIISRVLKKLILTIFTTAIIVLVKEWIFKGSYTTISISFFFFNLFFFYETMRLEEDVNTWGPIKNGPSSPRLSWDAGPLDKGARTRTRTPVGVPLFKFLL